MNKKQREEVIQFALDRGFNAESFTESIELMENQRALIARSANKLVGWKGENTAPAFLGYVILTVLQLSTYEDSEYMLSALESLKDIYQQALRDNASASELFEIMAQTSKFERNNNESE